MNNAHLDHNLYDYVTILYCIKFYWKNPEKELSEALTFPVGSSNPNELEYNLNKIKYFSTQILMYRHTSNLNKSIYI